MATQTGLQFPLKLRFKLLAIAPQVTITDATGQVRMYVKQKALRLKEAVTVFSDETQSYPLYTINADRIIDFSAKYNISLPDGMVLGAVKRQGMSSFWRVRYDILRNDQQIFKVQEKSGWVRMMDSMLGEVPLLGIFSGYFFHPEYLVSTPDERTVFRITKQPAFTESMFTIERIADETPPADQELITVSLIMMVLLERGRG